MAITNELAERQLDRVLAFFPRVDAKATGLFTIDAAMLGVISASMTTKIADVWYLALSAFCAGILIAASIAFLYICGFPHTKGGAGSLIYFGQIASRTETKFVSAFKSETNDARIDDLLGQIWRNSEILTLKFAALKKAFVLTALALVPWSLFIGAVAIGKS